MAQKIKNLIFDLGGVLFGIEIENAMNNLGKLVPPHARPQLPDWNELNSIKFFISFETGGICPEEFRQNLRSQFGIDGSDPEIDEAWNSLLLGLIPGSIELIRSLQGRYRLFLLSNSNLIHYRALQEECTPLFNLFEHCYFSFEMGTRKPIPEIYESVCEEYALDKNATLFIDDSEENVVSARRCGLQGLHYQQKMTLSILSDRLQKEF